MRKLKEKSLPTPPHAYLQWLPIDVLSVTVSEWQRFLSLMLDSSYHLLRKKHCLRLPALPADILPHAWPLVAVELMLEREP